MENIKYILCGHKKPTTKTIMKWQDEALDACKFLRDSDKFKGSIFKCFKVSHHFATIALDDCKELGKPFSRYFLKVFNELNKKA